MDCIKKNCILHGVDNVSIVPADVLSYEARRDIAPADVIVSNPPYIPTAEISSLQGEVLHEPLQALDGGADGMLFYRVLAEKWFPCLRDGGRMFLECAETQPEEIKKLFPMQAFAAKNCGAFDDFYGLPRFVVAAK